MGPSGLFPWSFPLVGKRPEFQHSLFYYVGKRPHLREKTDLLSMLLSDAKSSKKKFALSTSFISFLYSNISHINASGDTSASSVHTS